MYNYYLIDYIYYYHFSTIVCFLQFHQITKDCTCCCCFRATLYVGKYSTSLYASPSLVHDGVTVVVSDPLQAGHPVM